MLGVAVSLGLNPGVAGPASAVSAAIEPAAILNVMERVADWQLANPSRHKPADWRQGASFAGMMALAGISGDNKYRDAMLTMGEAGQWTIGPRKYHADDHAAGQTYAELYLQFRDPRMIAPMRAQFDGILASAPGVDSLDFTQGGTGNHWSRCDSLFMAPPAWLRLFAATGDVRYRDFAVTNWWRTSDCLYDKEEHLYFRDSTCFQKRGANGTKIFWSRGNAWVMGGLVRALQFLPRNDPARGRFERQFKEMAAAVLKCQQPDGLWRASLLDPESCLLKETSGQGFYTCALAWGVNQGLLDRAKHEPAVRKAWAALVGCVNPDGKLTHVQPVGADPEKFNQEATEIHGVGAFLLAGSEVYRLAVMEETKPVRVTVKNPSRLRRERETVALPLQRLPGAPVVMDAPTSRLIDSQIIEGELLFQVDLESGEPRDLLVLPGKNLPAAPPPIVKTFARFVPERMDDFAWESDRIAHRMYGPALIAGEGTISSGVDVWVKRTRNLVINKWYQSGDYHKDHGEGLDGYKVGPSRGCGGLGIWDGAKLRVSGNFKSQRVIATGPVRSVFELTYDVYDAGGRQVSEVKRLSIDAGSNFTRCESWLTGGHIAPLQAGAGIVKREGRGVLSRDRQPGFLSYWEPEMPPNGATGCAVILPGGVKQFAEDKANFLAVASVSPNKPFVYYFGAGWSKSGDFENATEWREHVRNFAGRLKTPLKATLH
jgi:rhamnogalacturonyl hydrolase YesR